ncbi:MAG: DUF6134 family protein [Nitrospirota bacterium]|nr:DUF6134 family protein [Nitrospirota bacterium]MDP2384053.1 DUF6134 family protein [Nitrospirota bacterium]MDP3597317.1 DUF6134 family protein [Nitrospirota bacterium]
MISACSATSGFRIAVAFLGFLTCLGSASQQAWSAASQTYDFKVFLGKDEIGHQRFNISSEGDRTQVQVDAQFTVKFLYITVYTYRHTNVETWKGTCLREIHAETDDNGDSFFVNGIVRNGQLQVQTQAGNWIGEGCIKTFAYWNPEWIKGERLLNSQTGEHQPVSILAVGEETIPVQGVPTRAIHRRIVTDKFAVDLWYTLNGRWVALQSTTKKGDTLRYTLQ